MTDNELLRHIERAPGSRAGYKQLVREFGLGGGRERRLLLEHLARLTAAGRLAKLDREVWGIRHKASSRQESRENLIAGKLDLHRDGFGFVRVAPGQKAAGEATDIFIPPPEINGAMQGDEVLVEVSPVRRGADADRRQGRIVRVLTRRNPTVVGVFRYARHERELGHKVIAFDEKMTQPILIPFDTELSEPRATLRSPHRVLGEEAAAQIAEYPDLEGLVVDVEITAWPTETRAPRGRILEVLGRQDDFGVDVEMVIRKHQLPRIFPANVLAEAQEVAHLDPTILALREDFRGRTIVTIDGETARDFDDAVEVREHSDGSWELDVHIADVAEYVQPGTALDLEARLRATSVYFPDRAIPMLPHELSTGICSLRPDEDRLVLSCRMRIDEQGEITGYEVVEGVIRSARRMTYTQVAAVIEGDAEARAQFATLAPHFEAMEKLAKILNKKRDRRGSIDFDLPEPSIEFDEQGAMKGVTRARRNWAHRLIEEFMLAANEAVASWLSEHAPALYRVHEKPDPKRIVDFEDTAAAFGYSLGLGNLPVKRFHTKPDHREKQRGGRNGREAHGGRDSRARNTHEVPDELPVTPAMYQKLSRKLAGKPEERILSYLMLRSLKQARYSEENEGHFALAASFYTHFTSPIRRYPDLIVHRIAKALLRAGVSGEGTPREGEPESFHEASVTEAVAKRKRHLDAQEAPVAATELNAIATESSEAERRADAAERELVEWKKIRYMAGRVGEEFDGLLLNATKYGLFVELDDLFVEGLVPITSLGALDGDQYTFRENTREIIGETWARKFRIGQKVRVLLERVDAVEKRLQFAIVLDEEAEARRPARFSRLGSKPPKPKGKGKDKGKRKSMQGSTPKHRIPAPKGTGKKPKRKR